MSVRVRFAPSPTGSLHLGNALSAVANRAYRRRARRRPRAADRRHRPGAQRLRRRGCDPRRSRLARRRPGTRGRSGRATRARASRRGGRRARSRHGAVRDADGSIRLAGTTLARADGTATYQLATVVDDLDLGITHIIRGSDHRPNEEVQQRIARALGGELPEVIHHGLLLGDDGKKLSKRAEHASVADLRDEGIPGRGRARVPRRARAAAPRRSPRRRAHPPARDRRDRRDARRRPRRRCRRPAGARPRASRRPHARRGPGDRPSDPRARAPLRSGTRRGRRSSGSWSSGARRPTSSTSRTPARSCASSRRSVGNLKLLRLALTGAERGPELWTVVAAVPRDEALRRAAAAITPR